MPLCIPAVLNIVSKPMHKVFPALEAGSSPLKSSLQVDLDQKWFLKSPSSAECCVNACVQGHSVAEVGSDSFTKTFAKVHGGMSYHKIPPTTSQLDGMLCECLCERSFHFDDR